MPTRSENTFHFQIRTKDTSTKVEEKEHAAGTKQHQSTQLKLGYLYFQPASLNLAIFSKNT